MASTPGSNPPFMLSHSGKPCSVPIRGPKFSRRQSRCHFRFAGAIRQASTTAHSPIVCRVRSACLRMRSLRSMLRLVLSMNIVRMSNEAGDSQSADDKAWGDSVGLLAHRAQTVTGNLDKRPRVIGFRTTFSSCPCSSRSWSSASFSTCGQGQAIAVAAVSQTRQGADVRVVCETPATSNRVVIAGGDFVCALEYGRQTCRPTHFDARNRRSRSS